MEIHFDHEKLRVYQEALQFVVWWSDLSRSIEVGASLKDQLDRAATSVCLNIAEGNGKSSAKDRCRFFEIARGSAFECAACLDVLAIKAKLTEGQVTEGKKRLKAVVSMLMGLIGKVSTRNFVAEDEAEYGFKGNTQHENENEHEHDTDIRLLG